MHESGLLWLRVAAVLYSLGLVHAAMVIMSHRKTLFPLALFAFYTGVVLQVVAVVESSLTLGRLPVNNFFETITLCSLIIGISFLIVYRRYHFSSLSVFIFPVVFLMTLIGSMETPIASWPNTRLRDAWLLIHVVLILLGYAGLLLTAVASIFYLIQERQLKRKRPSSLFDRLPPLATLDTL